MRPTRAQVEALKRVYDRCPIDPFGRPTRSRHEKPVSYLAFRRSAFFAFSDCLMVKWCGMVLGIEQDGHTHS